MATGFFGQGGEAVPRGRRGGTAAGLAVIAMALVVTLLPMRAVAQDAPATQTVFVPRTGHTSDGLFLDLWRTQRSLLGDPITEEFRGTTRLGDGAAVERTVQFYENAALVFVPDAPAGEQVRTLPIGREALTEALAGRPAAALIRAARRTACGEETRGCVGFRETGHTVHPAFRERWEEFEAERWLGMPVSEAYRAADGSWIQYFEGAALRVIGEEVEPLPIGTATAERLELDTRRVVRPNTVPLYAAALFAPQPAAGATPRTDRKPAETDPSSALEAPTAPVIEAVEETVPAPELAPLAEPAPEVIAEPAVEPEVAPEPFVEPEPEVVAPEAIAGPGPQQGAAQEIVISISAQQLWAYEGNELVNSTLVSTGTAEVEATTTPIGSHTILSKVDIQDMEGTISGEDYFVPDVPYVMYFDNLGNALHGTYWHSNFGAPMSHGCVNLPMDVAAWMYGWAGVGTAVTVIA